MTTHLPLDSLLYFQWPHTCYWKSVVFPMTTHLLMDRVLYFQWQQACCLTVSCISNDNKPAAWQFIVIPMTKNLLLDSFFCCISDNLHLILDRFTYFKWPHTCYWTGFCISNDHTPATGQLLTFPMTPQLIPESFCVSNTLTTAIGQLFVFPMTTYLLLDHSY